MNRKPSVFQSATLGAALFLSFSFFAGAGEVRRVALDGKEDVVAPEAQPGRDGVKRISKVGQPQLMLYPCSQKPSHGTVMVCPGGGYNILAFYHEGIYVAEMLNAAGWDAAVLLYHVSEGPKTRALALEDATAGLALLRKRGGELGLATNKIGVMGFSAGGHLCARLTHENAAAGNPPDFTALIYPAYLEKQGKFLDEAAPAKVPYFLYVANDDPYCPSSRAFVAACKEQNIACESHFAEKGGHGFGMRRPLRAEVADWPAKLVAFLNGLKQADQ